MSRVIALAEASTTRLKRALVRTPVAAWVLCAVLALGARTVEAQNTPRIRITPPTINTSATVSVLGVLADKKFDELMRSGFPVHVHVTAEVWRTGKVFDEIVAKNEWQLIVQFDTFDSNYEVLRITADSIVPLGAYKKLMDARVAAELAYAPPLGIPPRGRESYVSVQADVETMQMSDLEEVQRWLRGDARPAVQGKRNPGTAVVRGLRSLITRLLGAEVRHLDARTRPFTI
ncbi:MAG: hypothetical protein H7Z40_12205 [Phycisphaerae bacterium]|nr:hypothetical protein [Gemmatimonadaceae bacterium]